MGRHAISLSDAQIAEVETLAAVLNAEQLADYFGIGRTTFFAMVNREPEIAERYKRGKARAIGSIAGNLIAKARSGDTACMIFYLKTQGGWRETSVIEHGFEAPEEQFTTLDVTKLSDAALLEMVSALKDHEARCGPIEEVLADTRETDP